MKESKGLSPKRTKSTDDFAGATSSVIGRDEVVLPSIDFKKDQKNVVPLEHLS